MTGPADMNADNQTILISGAGIGGPTLAFWLKAAGFEPTLVERAPALRTGGYVVDFWGLGYDIAERMGLLPEIHRIGYHIRELRVVDDRGARVAGFGTRVFRELTGGRFVTIARSDLSRLLFEKLQGTVEVVFGDEVVRLRQHADCVEVRLRHAGERRFDLVIGADGLHSKTRKLVFGSVGWRERRLGYCVAAFEAAGYRPREEDVYVIYSAPGRMLGRFALHDDRTLFLFVLGAPGDPPADRLDLPAQKAFLREGFGGGQWECPHILAELDHTRSLYFDRVSQIEMASWSRGRVALLGDAASCVSLMAGQGAALAMTAAFVLAGELGRANGRHEEAFSAYEARLRAFIGVKQRGAARFAAAFAPRTRWGLFLRNQLLRAFALPGVARLAFGRDIVDTLRLPEYCWPKT
jgi:2-polyprenyl-6-methoxyphenol hydroxylase-like FAD-dependent oxidoreductase